MADPRYTFREEFIKCGKPTCKSCPHGPYWYGYLHKDGKMSKKYFGKKKPQCEPPPEKPKKEATFKSGQQIKEDYLDKVFSLRTVSYGLCCEIMEVDGNFTQDQLKRRYRKLSMEFHPDRSGTDKHFKRIACAFSFIMECNGWK